MTDKFPVRIHRREDNGVATFRATTALVKLAATPAQLQSQLLDFAEAYARTLAEARAALDAAKHDARERARAYWRVGKAIRDFETSLDAAGFYLVGQTETFARDLGLHPGSLRKIRAFQQRNPDLSALGAGKRWSAYRERRADDGG